MAAAPSLRQRAVLPTIVFSQFAGTSLWFAPNAIITQIEAFTEGSELALLTSMVQVGFIAGTLGFTYFAIADRFSAPIVFTLMSVLGALLNAALILTQSIVAWAILRLLIGACLAGIYPVGMKISATQYPDGLGGRLGIVIGALTLGTALPWLLRALGGETGSEIFSYQGVLACVSVLAASGGLLMPLVILRPGERLAALRTFLPEAREASGAPSSAHQKEGGAGSEDSDPQPSGLEILKLIWSGAGFRAAAIGYFGHMWELYAFWAYVPELVAAHGQRGEGAPALSDAMLVFLTISVGAVSSTLGGLWSLRAGGKVLPGSAVVAQAALITSLVCCCVAPAIHFMSDGVFIAYLLLWGSAVVADSGQFSSLTAEYAATGLVGTALTFSTCVGFGVTVVSIQLLGAILGLGIDAGLAFLVLAPGPAVGVAVSYGEWPLHWLCTRVSAATTSKSTEILGTPKTAAAAGARQL